MIFKDNSQPQVYGVRGYYTRALFTTENSPEFLVYSDSKNAEFFSLMQIPMFA